MRMVLPRSETLIMILTEISPRFFGVRIQALEAGVFWNSLELFEFGKLSNINAAKANDCFQNRSF